MMGIMRKEREKIKMKMICGEKQEECDREIEKERMMIMRERKGGDKYGNSEMMIRKEKNYDEKVDSGEKKEKSDGGEIEKGRMMMRGRKGGGRDSNSEMMTMERKTIMIMIVMMK